MVLTGPLFDILVPLLIVALCVAAGFIVRGVLFNRMRRLGIGRVKSVDAVISVIRRPFIFWWFLLGLFLALQSSFISLRWAGALDKLLLVLTVASVTLTVSAVVTRLIRLNALRLETTLQVSSLTDNITRVIVYLIGALIILNILGISLVPILAVIGGAGLAVALALQETVQNFFSGFHIVFSKQLKVGDFIRLEGGVEGFVADINWRTTKVRLLSGNLAFVPNSKLTSTIITDYCTPESELSISVDFTVACGSDLAKVEKVTLETAREVTQSSPGAVRSFEPSVRFSRLGLYGVDVSVSLRSTLYTDQFILRHEFIKALYTRYRREGIALAAAPVPAPPTK